MIGTIKQKQTFSYLKRKGRKFFSSTLLFVYHKTIINKANKPHNNNPSEEVQCQYGLTVSRKFGNAVKRNRIKRQLRYLVMQNSEKLLEKGIALVNIIPITKGKTVKHTPSKAKLLKEKGNITNNSFTEIKQDFEKFISHV